MDYDPHQFSQCVYAWGWSKQGRGKEPKCGQCVLQHCATPTYKGEQCEDCQKRRAQEHQ